MAQSLFTNTSTWIAADHVLVAEVDGYTETYRRFFFRDIKSVLLRRDNRRRNNNLVLGLIVLAGLSIAIAGKSEGSVETFWFGICLTLLFGLMMLINTLKGPSCSFHIRTAVQSAEISGLRRVPKAEKVMASIRLSVATERALLSKEDVSARFAARIAASAPPPLPPATPPLI